MAEESSFLDLYWTSLAVVGAVGVWESRSDFQAGCETRRVLPPASFPPPFFLRPVGREFLSLPSARRLAQLLEEFVFGLLHALRGFGVAAGGSDTLQHGEGESRA
jgi:hypothetical protein